MPNQNNNASVNINISGSEAVIASISSIVESFTKFNTKLGSVAQAIGKFNRDASNIGKGIGEISKAGKSVSGNNSFIEGLKKQLDLTQLKRTFDANKKYLTKAQQDVISKMMEVPANVSSKRGRSVILKFIEEQARFDKDIEKMALSEEKLAKKIAESRRKLMTAMETDVSNARVKKRMTSMTQTSPEITNMNAYYAALEKSSKKDDLRRSKAIANDLKRWKLNEEQLTKGQAKISKDEVLKKVNAFKLAQNDYWKRQEQAYNEDRQKAKVAAAKKKAAELKDKKLSIVSQLKEMRSYKKGEEVDSWIRDVKDVKSSAIDLKDSISTTYDTLYSRLAKMGALIGSLSAGFMGAMVVVKNWAYDIITTTEKLRGYNIALLGSMKTQKDVNNLLKASEEITRDLPVGYEQMIMATKALSMISPLKPLLKDSEKSNKVLKDTWNIILGLSQIEPEWGISGAIFSLREALSGDLLSLKRRFEIPVDFVTTNDGKKISEVKNMPEKMLEGLSNFMSQSFGQEALQMTANQFGAVLNKIENLYTKFKAAIGESGIYDYVVSDLKKVLVYFEEFSQSNAFDSLTKDISNTLIAMYENVKRAAWGIAETIGKTFGRTTESMAGGITDVKDALQELNFYMKWLANILSAKEVQDWAASMAQKTFKAINWLVETFMSLVSKASNFFNENIEGYYSGFMSVVNKIRGIVGDEGLLLIALVGPGNALYIIMNAFRVAMGSISSIIGLYTIWKASSLSVATNIETTDKAIKAANASTLAWVASMAKVGLATLAIYKSYQHLSTYLMGNRTLGQYFGFGETPEQKAQTKVNKFEGELKKYNEMISARSLMNPKISDYSANMNEMMRGVDPFKDYNRDTNYKTSHEETMLLKSYFDELKTLQPTMEEFLLANKANMQDEEAFRKQEEDWFTKLIEWTKEGSNNTKKVAELAAKSTGGNSGSPIAPLTVEDLKMKAGVDLAGVKQSTIDAGKTVAAMFSQQFGNGFVVTSGASKLDKHAENSKHYSGEALDFSVNGVRDVEKYYDKKFLMSLGEQLKNSGSTLTFENSSTDIRFELERIKPILEEINKSLGSNVLDARTNSGASAAHLHMAMGTGTGNPRTGIGGSPWLNNYRPEGTAADQVDYKVQYEKILSASKEYAEYLKAYGETTGAVRKTIKSSNDYAKNILSDVTLAFNKEGDPAKVGYEQVQLLNSSLENMKAERKNFPKVFDLIQKNIESAAQIIPAVTSLGDTGFGRGAWSMISKIGSSAISGGLKNVGLWNAPEGVMKQIEAATSTGKGNKSDMLKALGYSSVSLNDYIMQVLQGSIDEAEKTIPEDSKRTMAIMQSMVREAASKRDSKFFRVIPDIQQRILMEIINSYNEILPNEMADFGPDVYKKMFTKLQQVGLDVMSGSDLGSALDKLSDDVAESVTTSVSSKLKKMSNMSMGELAGGGAISGVMDIASSMFENNVFYNAVVKVKSALDGAAKSGEAASMKIEDTNASLQKEISLSKTMAGLMKYRGHGNRATRSAWYNQYQSNLELEPQSNSFQVGIESSLSNFKNWSEQMFEIGAQLVTDLSGVFETNFFDVLSGKFKNFADMFRGLGNAIKDMILKIIAKMAALSATKLILGVDISGEMGGGSSGFGGILNSIVGGGNGGGGILGSIFGGGGKPSSGGFDIGSMLTGGAAKVASGGVANFLNPMSLLTNFGTGAAGAKLAGTSGGIFGKVSSMFGKAGKWITANPLLSAGILGAGMFLSQPGRLFGGAKDKTGPAQEQYAAASSSRDAMVKRRQEDATNYFASGNASNISNFAFGNIGYSTWSSGDGWFKGPKEKHAATDASAFNASMKVYYDLLKQSAYDHAMKMRSIDKLKEVNEVAGLKEEQSVKQRYLNLLNTDYANANTAQDFVKMDELRDKVQEAQNELYQLQDDIIAAQINMAKAIKEGLKSAGENFVATLTGLKGTNYTSGNTAQLGSFYKMQQDIIKGGYISKENMAAFGANPNEISGLQAVKKYSGSWFNRKSTTLGYNYGEEGKADLLAALDEYVNNYLKQLRISNIQAQSKVNATDMFNNLNNTFVSPLMDIYTGMKDTKKMMDTLRGIPEATEEYYQVQFEYSEYQEKLSEQIKSWMNSGLISKDPTYWTAILNGPLDKLQSVFEQVASQVRFKDFKNTIFDAMKGFETNADFNNVVNMVKGAGGDASLYSGMTTGTDPWESWYNWSLDMIKTKMKNAQRGSEEFYAAQEELFRLMAEKADRQKQNAEEAYDKIEEALGKIEETMKVRIAEESKTAKGDTYFIDVGASRDATKQLEALLSKVNTNDPKAKELIEAFRKRIMGIRS